MRLRDGLIASFSCGLFIALFLILYQPFGTYEFRTTSKYWFLSGYGLIVFAVMAFCWFVVVYLIKPIKTPAHRTIITMVVSSFTFALLATFIYKQWYFQEKILWSALWDYLPFGVATGLIPIASIIAWQLKKAKTTSDAKIILADTNGKDMLTLNPQDLFFIKANDNYIEIHYQLGATIESTLLRNTLNAAANTLNGNVHLLRCHRSYLVNLLKVKKTHSQKDRLTLYLNSDLTIPVSRQYKETVLNQLAKN
ncbi:LytTR family DNA-binding domain-containing protein [Marinicella sp. W31]|uniref:LytTR family DNA-binding domain-containing protein n=1 Tax=Marinicella sp. W31 TaxID=3023713 RepID=UPI0037578A79